MPDILELSEEEYLDGASDSASGSPASGCTGRRPGHALIRDGVAIGVIIDSPHEVRPFTASRSPLLETFADQAVIAIENARLFGELQDRTRELAQSVEELQALGAVSQAVSSTLDLQQVLTTVLEHAVELSGMDGGSIFEYDEATGEFHDRATLGLGEVWPGPARGAAAHRRGHAGPSGAGARSRSRWRTSWRRARTRPHARARWCRRLSRHAGGAAPARGRDHRRAGGPPRHARRGAAGERWRCCRPSPASPPWPSRTPGCSTRSRRRAASSRKPASTNRSSWPTCRHELRTPLNAILGYTELILDEIYGDVPAKIAETLDRVQTSGRHLLGLINDVLDLSKMEAGQLVLAPQEYALADVIQTVHTAVESLASEKGIGLRTEVAPDLPMGYGDDRRLVQVILNLVGNAIKFTDRGEVVIARLGVGRRTATGRRQRSCIRRCSLPSPSPTFLVPCATRAPASRPSSKHGSSRSSSRPTRRARARRAGPAWG